MPFPRRLLNEDEQVVIDVRPHWIVLTWPLLALAASIAAAVFVSTGADNDVLLLMMLVVVLVVLGWFLYRLARWATTNLVVTSDRLIVRSGIIAKRGREIPLERINDITVTQSIVNRLLRSGDLVVESAGERGQESFPECPRPTRVQNEIYVQMEAARDRDLDRQAGRRPLSPLEQLEKLDELRQRGVISQAEFEVKKAKLLDQL
ncbi:MAG TPA: PH domain-containing protein [Acidimicrobiales bacterium]|nr:PH domain-containing protein [Acidimicrobiales bacterium]